MRWLKAEKVKTRLTGGGEISFLDVREHGQYGEGHPFFAVLLPYSRLEIEAPRLLPCKAVQIILLDDGDGVADKAAARLVLMDDTNLRAAICAYWLRQYGGVAGRLPRVGRHVAPAVMSQEVVHSVRP
jgi:rhodanese-related sulfurtransferase